MKFFPLLSALREMLPGADFAITGSRDWNSITFSGKQIGICAQLSGAGAEGRIRKFAQALPEQVFSIPGWLVADLAVTHSQQINGKMTVVIEVLLLGE